jgi:hypothetical protein
MESKPTRSIPEDLRPNADLSHPRTRVIDAMLRITPARTTSKGMGAISKK